MRYYFHIRHHATLLKDPDGTELGSLEIVRKEAFDSAREIIADRIKGNNPVHTETIFEVRDENDDVVHMLPFASVLLSFLSLDTAVAAKGSQSEPHLSRANVKRKH